MDSRRSGVRRDGDTIQAIKDGASSTHVLLETLKYGWGVTKDVDAFRGANSEKGR